MTTPDKYKPEPRKYDQKHWLYEQYWSKFHSTYEIAKMVGVSADTIKRRLREFGIPRRDQSYRADGNVSAFSGFYSGEAAQVDDGRKMTSTIPEERDPQNLNWQKIARKDNTISDKAVLGD